MRPWRHIGRNLANCGWTLDDSANSNGRSNTFVRDRARTNNRKSKAKTIKTGQYAPAGSINMATGVFTPTSTYVGPSMLIYGGDAAIYAGVGSAGADYYNRQ